ncbi:MAG: hypothetical protein Q9195_005552 [Heterodermia aff. obscurata]
MAEHIRERVRIDSPSIPRYTIDLSSPPILRYQHVAKDFLPQLASLTPLFSEIIPRPFFRKLAALTLRRLHSKEQTSELRGIQRVTKVGMHLLVALNVLLDLMMGCTSGGVRVNGSKMLHFRTLDWGMHPLRKIIVHLDYIRDGAKVAECVTYVGYVGVLTGVSAGLSVSLNFRPVHNARSWLAQLRFYFHHALVLVGLRPAIASMLRELLIPSGRRWSLQQIETGLPERATTAAYLIFCDGQRTLTLEKDHRDAVVNSSAEFIVVTNHDRAQERARQSPPNNDTSLIGIIDQIRTHGIVAESTRRKKCMTQMWEQRSGRLSPEQLVKWMDTYPITNALTHYAVIMDPSRGTFAWEKYYPDARALWDQLNGRGDLR